MTTISLRPCQHCGGHIADPRKKLYCSQKCSYDFKRASPAAKVQDKQTYASQQLRGYFRKKELILSKGGCCEACGYAKNLAALCFHHIDPSQKERRLDMRNISNGKMSDILAEAAKCQLLCNNCHMELHHPQASLI